MRKLQGSTFPPSDHLQMPMCSVFQGPAEATEAVGVAQGGGGGVLALVSTGMLFPVGVSWGFQMRRGECWALDRTCGACVLDPSWMPPQTHISSLGLDHVHINSTYPPLLTDSGGPIRLFIANDDRMRFVSFVSGL